MDLMHNEISLDFCHKTLLAYCKRSIIETDSFERKDNKCNIVRKSPEATIVKKELNVINVAIWKQVNYKTSAAIIKAIMK